MEPAEGSSERVRSVDLRDYVTFDPEHARRVRVFATDVLTVDLWCLEPNQDTPPVTSEDIDVAYTVVGGAAWFVTADGEVGLGPLGSILVSATVEHRIENRSADPLVVLATASPPDVPLDQLMADAPVELTEQAVHRPRQRRGLVDRLRDTPEPQ